MFNKKKAQQKFEMESQSKGQPKKQNKIVKIVKTIFIGGFSLILLSMMISIMNGDDEPTKEENAKVEVEDEKNEKEEAKAEKKALEEDYKRDIRYNSQSFSEVFKDFATHNQKLEGNMFLINNQDWIVEMGGIIARFRSNIEEANAIDAPSSMQEVHEKYMKAMDEYKIFADDYPKAMDNRDWDRIEEISKHIDAGNKLIDEASDLLMN